MNIRNKTAILCLALSGAGLLTGCISREKIAFSDEPAVTAQQPSVAIPASPPVQKLSPADALAVDTVVYGYLLQRDFWVSGEYTAVFLQGDDEEVALLQKQFPSHLPPVKSSSHALLQPNRTPVDKDTGRPAMILSVETSDPVNDSVEAFGRWYAGGAVSGFYQFRLKKVGFDWVIDSVR